MSPLNVLSFGASRNIGYLSALRLLEKGGTVTFLLRSPSAFDADATIQKYVKSGHARLLRGDATIEADVQRAWDEAGVVDAVIFSVGSIMGFSVTKGFVQTPPNLVTHPRSSPFRPRASPAPSHAALPLPLKPLHAMVLPAPRKDRIGMERVIAHCAGWRWDSKADGEVAEGILDQGWMQRKGLPAAGSLRHALVVRPAMLTDGRCVTDELEAKGKGKLPYHVSEQELGGYTISRKDIAHFVVNALTRRWDEVGKQASSAGGVILRMGSG
ncbi:hypothetical protein B0H14DRAFT_3662119 [Mycena olivaceomarginata]|nr:hypothetical protein B0H14DRAFT_3662119 [Mycena olivaceomarginata]